MERHLSDQIRQSRHLIRLELGVGEDGDPHQHPLFHRVVDQILQRPQRILELFPAQAKRHGINLGGNIRQPGMSREQRPLPKKLPWSQYLIHVLTIPKPNIVHLHPPLLQNIKHLPHIPLVNNAISLRKAHRRQRIRDLDQHRLVQIRQESHLAQNVQHVLLLTRIVVCEHVPKGPLIDLPELAVRVGNARRRAGTVVQQRQLPKAPPARTRPDVIAIHGKANIPVLHNVKVISHLALLDDYGARGDRIGLHGIDEEVSFFFREGGEDEIVREGVVYELYGGVGLGEVGDDEVLGHVQRFGENILGALGLVVDVDGPFPAEDIGGLHVGIHIVFLLLLLDYLL
mmetsp:Transcript_5817/g.11338  ORF Transcript_5817/g.11338 Transcript_5817/m.11338 type:complete len:343 (-) Transcript_5817:260-1288(-)